MTLSGGRNDTVMDNTFSDNGAWGFLFVPYPDSGTPSLGQTLPGHRRRRGVRASAACTTPRATPCSHNTFTHNGYFGNPSNADYGQIVFNAGQPQNCFAGNTRPQRQRARRTSSRPSRPAARSPPRPTPAARSSARCCATPASAPARPAPSTRSTPAVVMHPLPKGLPTMPNPCAGVPANAWCPGGKPV